MNKKIYKGYELAEAVDNGILSLEQKVKSADNMTYFECTIDFVLKDVAKNIMFEYFELLEDNTEEIEELDKFDIQGLEVSGYSMTQAEYLLEDGIEENRQKINELVKAVNQIRKDLNK